MTLKEEKEKFTAVSKLILKENLSKNPIKLEEYKVKIIDSFNVFIAYCKETYNQISEEDKVLVIEAYKYIVGKLVACLQNLNCSYPTTLVPFEFIEQTSIVFLNVDNQDNISPVKPPTTEIGKNKNMEDHTGYLAFCKSILNEDFKGDPLA